MVWTEGDPQASLIFFFLYRTLLSLHSFYELYTILYTYVVWLFYTKVIVNDYKGLTRVPSLSFLQWLLNFKKVAV